MLGTMAIATLTPMAMRLTPTHILTATGIAGLTTATGITRAIDTQVTTPTVEHIIGPRATILIAGRIAARNTGSTMWKDRPTGGLSYCEMVRRASSRGLNARSCS